MMRSKIHTGLVFQVPSTIPEILVGLVVRVANRGAVLFGSFFALNEPFDWTSFDRIVKSESPIWSHQYFSTGLVDGRWRAIGDWHGFKFEEWPLPLFYSDLNPASLLARRYSDNGDFDIESQWTIASNEVSEMVEDGISEYLGVEAELESRVEIVRFGGVLKPGLARYRQVPYGIKNADFVGLRPVRMRQRK